MSVMCHPVCHGIKIDSQEDNFRDNFFVNCPQDPRRLPEPRRPLHARGQRAAAVRGQDGRRTAEPDRMDHAAALAAGRQPMGAGDASRSAGRDGTLLNSSKVYSLSHET